MKKNAIILAAGKTISFAPFTYEKPKGLLTVKGEVLIERQIQQLKDAGVSDIYVVVGYMKEKFFYLEEKYGVNLLINNKFNETGNLYSLYIAKEYLGNSFICCADQYFKNNPFLDGNTENKSYRACTSLTDNFKEFSVQISDENVITNMLLGGKLSNIAMIGHAYFNNNFSEVFIKLMNEEIDDFRINSLFWEEFYAKHITSLTLYAKLYDKNEILEFDSIKDLREFDSDFLLNVDSDIVNNICNILKCSPNDIINIDIIQAGLTNVSFSFDVNDIKYVYRHPGGTSGQLIDRKTECYAQMKAKELEIDKSVIHIDSEGWKISYYVPNLIECDLDNNDNQLNQAMLFLKKLHAIVPDYNQAKIFDTFDEAMRLLKVASASKGNLLKEFSNIIEDAKELDVLLKEDFKFHNMELVLCHNDTYAPNYLVTSDEEMYLIDWEYAGINDPANDIACILCRYDFSEEEVDKYLKAYLEDAPQWKYNHFKAYIGLCAFYWFCWGLYKGSVGDDDGFFFLPAYRNCLKYLESGIELLQNSERRE